MESINDIYKDCLDYLESFKEIVYLIGFKRKDIEMLKMLRGKLEALESEFSNVQTGYREWIVNSESNGGQYKVRFRNGKWSCSCNSHLYTGVQCKHMQFIRKSLDK